MKVLVIGASGLVGSYLMRALKRWKSPEPIVPVGTYYLGSCNWSDPETHQMIHLNLLDHDNTIALIQAIDPEAICLVGGITDVDRIELDTECGDSWAVNVLGTKAVVTGANKSRRCNRLIFLSSDYVFDGNDGPYDEDRMPNPCNRYGRQKLLAENYILSRCKCNPLIIRTCGVFGQDDDGLNFGQRLISKVRHAGESPFKAVSDQWGTPTYANDLAVTIFRELSPNSIKLRHFANAHYCTRFEFAKILATAFGISEDSVSTVCTRDLDQAAPRPKRGGLISKTCELPILGNAVEEFYSEMTK